MNRTTLALLLVAAVAWAASAHADPEPALDRQLVERLVRAEEAQAHALEGISRAIERAGSQRCR